MKQADDEIIIISRRNFSEYDRIITVLGKEYGKTLLMAKGVRKPKSKLAGSVELFSVVRVQYVSGKGSFYTLIGARLVEHLSAIVKDMDRTNIAYEQLKIIDKISDLGQGQEFFEVIKNSLYGLNKMDTDLNIIKIWFGISLLKISGHLPNLRTNSKDLILTESSSYEYDFDDNCFNEKVSGRLSVQHIKLLRVLSASSRPANIEVDERITQETSQLVDQILHLQLY
jgi:DNA repair protein RecO (recombination protein O)